MAGRLEYFYSLVILALSFVTVTGQESINAAKGINVGMHAGIALLMTFGILGTCAVSVNILTRYCAKRLRS